MKIVPFDKREVANKKKSFAASKSVVEPVARDTNKTRRKTTRARLVGETVKTEKPVSNLKKDLKKIAKKSRG